MKKLLLSMMLCISAMLSAQNGVTVSGLAINAGTVTFNVSWNKNMPVALWSDTVWVFVDYNKAGKMERLPLSAGATLTATSAPGVGKVIEETGNNNGVWIVGNARTNGSFSATVQLLTATAAADFSGACAYASNYPPVGEYISATKISFTGTPMYNIVLRHENGSTVTVQSGGTFLLPCDYILTSFTDATTGAPGIMKCVPPATYILSVSASSFCAGTEGVQFSLSDTEVERKYQLYRNNSEVGAVLNGTGDAATFTGSFNVAGTYTTRTVADDLYCETAMDGTYAVIENPLPTTPYALDVSRQCPGTVTLSASSSGAVIDWYADITTMSPFHTGTSYTTPEIETSTTYYIQARIAETGCLSARMPVAAEVNMEGCCNAPGTTGVTFAEFNPCIASYGSTYTLTDDRDSKQYKVKYMPDGHYWMVQDLMFGNCTESSYIYDNSEAATTRTPTVAPGYVGHCRTNTRSGAGYMYGWAATMNNTKAYYSSSNSSFQCIGTGSGTVSPNPGACRGICPDGWHVPTGSTAGEYQALHAAMVSSYKCSNDACWNASSAWEGVLGGYCIQGALYDQDSRGYYWSSTYYDAYAAYRLRFYSGTVNPGTDRYDKDDGYPVRCIKNY
jgi:uncharacterized protein (TIGR02145 family)